MSGESAHTAAQRCAAPHTLILIAAVAYPVAVGDIASSRRRRHCSSSVRVRVGEGVPRNSDKSAGVSMSSAMRGSRTTVDSVAYRLRPQGRSNQGNKATSSTASGRPQHEGRGRAGWNVMDVDADV